MSRAYRVEVEAIGICVRDICKLMQRFMWVELGACEHEEIAFYSGEGCLSGGQSEEEAHDQITKALKAINPQALVKTRWTYVEELPYSEYGDRIDRHQERRRLYT